MTEQEALLEIEKTKSQKRKADLWRHIKRLKKEPSKL